MMLDITTVEMFLMTQQVLLRVLIPVRAALIPGSSPVDSATLVPECELTLIMILVPFGRQLS